MTTQRPPHLDRIRRGLAVAAAAAFIGAAVLGWSTPLAIALAYRFALFACLGPALGALFLVLIHRMSGGEWGDMLHPFLAPLLRLAPWLCLGLAPLLWWSRVPGHSTFAYESASMLSLRAGVYVAGLFFAVMSARPGAATWMPPAALLGIVFLLHLMAEDWLGALEPRWHSTAFPLVWMTGQAVAGLAIAILLALAFGRFPSNGLPHREIGLDWGNLLLAAMLLWCYVAFAQFLIIWAGNLPREISWYVHRTTGPWAAVPALLLAIHFLLPLAILLSRRLKRSAVGLGAAAAVLLGAQWIYCAWVVLPASPNIGLRGSLLALAALAFAGALCARQCLTGAQRLLAMT